MAFTLESGAFANGQPIPERYTGDGENFSPPLQWSGFPEQTKSFVLVIEDPDAPSGVFGHWGIYNLTGDSLDENDGNAAAGFQVRNDFGNQQYDGPLPPKAHGVHHYQFRIAALQVPALGFEVPPSVGELWQRVREHVIDEALLVGTYER